MQNDAICAHCGNKYSEHKNGLQPKAVFSQLVCGGMKAAFEKKKTNKVVCAAIQDKNHGLWLGKSHSDCIFIMSRFGNKYSAETHEQGFVDMEFNFLSRTQAYELAREAGQISDSKDLPVRELFSDEIY